MAKTETTVKGYVYTVTSPNGGTVTDAEGKLNKTVDAGDQLTVQAPSDSLTCSDDDAVIYKTNFKNPLLALSLIGQGVNALPAGYTRLEFLESTGGQYIDTGLVGASSNSYVDFRGETYSPLKRAFQGSGWGVTAPKKDGDMYAIVPKENAINYFTGYIKGMALGKLNATIKLGSVTINGKTYTQDGFKIIENPNGTINENHTLKLGAFPDGVSYVESWWVGKCHGFKAQLRNGAVEFAPAIAPTGEPCMFDRVSKQPFRNAGTGSFIAGVGTVAQLATLLRNLPATGGALTLSLPAEANTPEVAEALQACHDTKGWTLTVHEYRPAATATYSLRRVRTVVWCRREQSNLGSYVDATGIRWQIDRCAAIFGALGQDPAAYGYTPFDSVEQAAQSWELQPYVDPNAEELSTNFEK